MPEACAAAVQRKEKLPLQMLSLTFLLLVLPVGLLVNLLAPERLRPSIILGFSLLCFFAAQPWSLTLMLTTVLLDYLALQLMHRFDERERARRSILCFAILKNLTVIVYAGSVTKAAGTQPVLGVLVYTLLGIDCVVSAYYREIPAAQSPVAFGLYACFFPRLYAGPFQTYQEHCKGLEAIRPGAVTMREGLGLLLAGALKVLLLGRYLSVLYDSLATHMAREASVLSSWLLVLALALLLYYRLSGYCDMARGVGLMFGLHLPQSFYYPYQSRGISDFFQRFHSTLWNFLQRTARRLLHEEEGAANPTAGACNLIVLGVLFGMWFGLGMEHVIWGAFLAAFMAAETYLFCKIPLRPPVLLRRLYNLAVVLVSFAFLTGNSIGEGFGHFVNLFFPPGIPLASNRVKYLLSTNWLLLAISLFFATNAASLLVTALRRQFPRLYRGLALAGEAAMLVVVVALLT